MLRTLPKNLEGFEEGQKALPFLRKINVFLLGGRAVQKVRTEDMYLSMPRNTRRVFPFCISLRFSPSNSSSKSVSDSDSDRGGSRNLFSVSHKSSRFSASRKKCLRCDFRLFISVNISPRLVRLFAC